MILTKMCSTCKETLPFENFYRQDGTKDGKQYECKVCSLGRVNRNYHNNPKILEKNKLWQAENKDKHNEAAKRYYHSPTGRMNRGLNKSLDHMLGKKRAPLVEIIGTSVSALVVHLLSSLPENLTLDDYELKWYVGFVHEPQINAQIATEDIPKFFNWKNLCVREKSFITEDFGVSLF